MANTDSAFGLLPVRHLNGASWDGRFNEYPIASTYGTDLLPGDPVKMVSGGTIERAAAGDPILGVFVGCRYTAANDNGILSRDKKYWPASTVATDAFGFVVDDPGVIFQVQIDDAGTALAATDVGGNADILVTAGSTATFTSGVELDQSTITGNSAQLRIMRLADLPNNEWGDFAKVEVLINEHFYKSTTGI
jgi:hypothetical protein